MMTKELINTLENHGGDSQLQQLMSLTASHLKDYMRLHQLADEFVNDVMPQIGRLTVQRYDNLNELCILLTEMKEGS